MFLKKLILILGLVFYANSSSARDSISYIIHTSTYGLIAGSLLGAASLAFTSDPGNHMGNVFKGASLGLYGGMIYGAYRSYGQEESLDYAFIPLWNNSGNIDGAFVHGTLLKF